MTTARATKVVLSDLSDDVDEQCGERYVGEPQDLPAIRPPANLNRASRSPDSPMREVDFGQ